MAAEVGDPQRQDWSIGHEVVLRTTLGEEISSTIFAYDKQANLLLLKEPGSHNGVSNLRFLKANFVKEVVSVGKPKGPVDLQLPHVDLDRCRRREEKALQQAEVESSKVGVGVTKEAQAIFDSLAKTLPCRWQGKTIIILDEVSVEEPYTVDKVTASDAVMHKPTLDRVKKVLQSQRQRLGL